MKEGSYWFPFLAAVTSNVIWGSTFLASKKILVIAPAFSVISLRFLIAILVLFFIGVVKKNDFQLDLIVKSYKALILLGLISYSFLYALQMIGLKLITSADSAIIMLLAPLFSIIIESIRSSKITKVDFISVFVGFIGALIILLGNQTHNISSQSTVGLFVTILSSFFLGLSVVLTKWYQDNLQKSYGFKLSVFNLTFFSMLIGTIGILPFAFNEIITGQLKIQTISGEFILWSLYLGILCSVVAFYMWNWSILNTNSVVTSVSMYIKTPVAIFLAAYLLNEQLSVLFFIGSVLIISPLIIKQVSLSRGVI